MQYSKLITVQDPRAEGDDSNPRARDEQSRWYCEQLEEGNILSLPETPFDFPLEEQEFLLSQRQTRGGHHKNIAYRPIQDRLTGFAHAGTVEKEKLHAIMKAYSERVTQFLSEMLPLYSRSWRLDFASFRPLEEQGRQLRLRARNDLLHTDAFPTRPTNGDRILRFFTNINPTEARVWVTSETFESLAHHYGRLAGLPLPRERARSLGRRLGRAFARVARRIGLPVVNRSPYDEFMLRFHHYLKENREFQETCQKQKWEFPPKSSWIVFTDAVSHVVVSGRFALEQTFTVPRVALLLPQKAPISILESLCGGTLTNS